MLDQTHSTAFRHTSDSMAALNAAKEDDLVALAKAESLYRDIASDLGHTKHILPIPTFPLQAPSFHHGTLINRPNAPHNTFDRNIRRIEQTRKYIEHVHDLFEEQSAIALDISTVIDEIAKPRQNNVTYLDGITFLLNTLRPQISRSEQIQFRLDYLISSTRSFIQEFRLDHRGKRYWYPTDFDPDDRSQEIESEEAETNKVTREIKDIIIKCLSHIEIYRRYSEKFEKNCKTLYDICLAYNQEKMEPLETGRQRKRVERTGEKTILKKIYFPKSLADKVSLLAKEGNLSFSAMVNEIVSDGVSAHSQKQAADPSFSDRAPGLPEPRKLIPLQF